MTTWYDATADATTIYSYYKGGNLAKIFSNGDFISFTYGGGDGIADRIVVYDGQLLSYDMIGNPLTYRDGMSFTWKNGRQLATFTQGQTSASYNYNESGIRTDKTVNGITTAYQLDGSKIVSENRNGNIIQYYYDETNSVIGLRYNGNDYFFRGNLQGDIIAILNTSGQTVVSYEYDPWGNILSVTGSMSSTLGVANPFRYRGYYYDAESGLYYLQTRYYDPATGRFINADGYTSTGQGLLGNDMYAYCLNNPISYSDPAGNASVRIIIPSETEGAIIFQKICKNPQQIPLTRPSQKPDKISASGDTKNRIPPDHPDYKPPKGGPRWVKVPDSKKSGWLDSNGSIWIPDPNMHGGEGWVVQPKFGEHSHAYPGGGTRNHFVDVPQE